LGVGATVECGVGFVGCGRTGGIGEVVQRQWPAAASVCKRE
jgi:hypothetical protein